MSNDTAKFTSDTSSATTAPADNQHIAILRLSALGDISHVLPLVKAIIQHQPASRIDWIIAPAYLPLVPRHPNLHLIPFDKNGGWAAVRQFKQQLADNYTALLHCQTSLRANLLSRLIKADRKIGWDHQRSREGQRWCVNEHIPEAPPQHQVQGFLAFARALGIGTRQVHWGIKVSAAAQHFARREFANQKRVLAISPCSSHPLRNWHATGYAAIADYAVNQHNMQVCLLGGHTELERQMADAIIQHATSSLTDLTGKDKLPEMLGLLQHADIVLSPDAGPVHWANALGTPVIGLYAATWSKRSGPYNSLDLCVDKFTEAAQQHYQCPPEKLRWGKRIEKPGVMQMISIDDVKEKLDKALLQTT